MGTRRNVAPLTLFLSALFACTAVASDWMPITGGSDVSRPRTVDPRTPDPFVLPGSGTGHPARDPVPTPRPAPAPRADAVASCGVAVNPASPVEPGTPVSIGVTVPAGTQGAVGRVEITIAGETVIASGQGGAFVHWWRVPRDASPGRVAVSARALAARQDAYGAFGVLCTGGSAIAVAAGTRDFRMTIAGPDRVRVNTRSEYVVSFLDGEKPFQWGLGWDANANETRGASEEASFIQAHTWDARRIGRQTLCGKATDAGGRTAHTCLNLTVEGPLAAFHLPARGFVGQETAFSVEVLGAQPVTGRITFGEGGAYSDFSAPGPGTRTMRHHYLREGRYPVRAEVKDGRGNVASDSVTIVIVGDAGGDVTTANWAGTWNCANPARLTLKIAGAGSSSSLIAYAPNAGPYKYAIEGIDSASVHGTYVLYERENGPVRAKGSWHAQMTGNGLLRYQHTISPTHFSEHYTCRRGN